MNFVRSEMMRIFERLYNMRECGGPVFELYMRSCLMLLMEALPAPTLVDVPRLFEEEAFRRFLLARCHNPVIKGFWENQAARVIGDASLSNIGPYITSKLNSFTGNSLIRPIIGQRRSTIDFRRLMDDGKIVLVNLAKGRLGEVDCRLLGMLLLGKLFLSALGRTRQSVTQRRSMHLYIDECQNFLTDTVGMMLSEARKFGLHLVLSNQSLTQLQDRVTGMDLSTTILTNCDHLLAMRIGVQDAGRLADWFRPVFSEADLARLPDHCLAARLVGGIPSKLRKWTNFVKRVQVG
ncbi:MAG: TraM recognition domain-containing protein [Geminicoccaceae bacterium]|nr:TraM recognition domain-containing protein [Geminicoccaceae bacterium]